jgi:glycosyltransferase involved in cell wall biosynthesis
MSSGSRSARVALVISSLDAGGAERVISIMANHWASRGRGTTVITNDSAATDFYALDPRVTRIALGVAGESHGVRQAVARNAHRIGRLRSAIRSAQPDVVISFMTSTNVLSLIAGGLERVPVIVSERTDPTQEPVSPIWNGLRRLAYPRAHAVVVQTPEVQSWADRFLQPERVHTIPNPVVLPPETLAEREDSRRAFPDARRRVVAMGRLHQQKGFDVLLRAFAKCRVDSPDWALTIIGEGEERSRLQALVSELALEESVEMLGRVKNPFVILRRADLFVLSSRYEGFPNALLEAMAAGAPVVATDCRSGPRHIVRQDIDGLLVPPEDVDALADAMGGLMRHDLQRRALAARAAEVKDRFSVDRVIAQWEHLLEQALPAARRKASA